MIEIPAMVITTGEISLSMVLLASGIAGAAIVLDYAHDKITDRIYRILNRLSEQEA